MGLPQRLLTSGEDLVLEMRPHWSVIGRPIPALVVGVGVLIGVTVAFPSAVAVGEVLLALVGLCALWLGVRVLRWSTTWLVVTTERLVQRSGVLARRGTDLRLVRVNEVSYSQSILGRVLGYGQLCVEVGGERGLVCFAHVRRPAAVAAVLHEQIDAIGNRPLATSSGVARAQAGGPVAPGPRGSDDTPPTGVALRGADPGEQGSLARQLIELDELRRRGLLSDEEFAEQKARLLRRQ